MKKSKPFCFALVLGFIPLIFYMYRHWEDISLSSMPATHSLDYGYFETINSRNFTSAGPDFYKLLQNRSSTSEETGGEDDYVDTELENERCERKIHSSPISLELKHRQYGRKKRIHDLCNSKGILGFNGEGRSFDDIPNLELRHLLVDDRHGIIYCYVPKVACTEWKRIMIVLSESLKVNGVPYKDPSDIPVEQVHGQSIQHLNKYPKAVMNQKLHQYKKFIFVREPFVRLISAYRDKFLKENEQFYKRYAVSMLKRFSNVSNPPASVKEALAAGIVPSFFSFIEYILSLPEQKYELLNEHWRQVAHMCHPCQIDYDFIGKMETMEEDAGHLLRMLGVDNIIQFPKSESNRTDETWIKSWFLNIPTEWRRRLYKLYEADFVLFGYQNPEDFLHL